MGKTGLPNMTRFIPSLIVFVLVATAYLPGGLEPLETALMDLRFNLLKRDVSGEIVVVDIDAKSLRELDTWPWPRGYHAELLDRLREAGARNIAFDINFAAKSTPEADDKLAAALAETELHGVGNFYIDFGIRAETLPRLSYVDVLRGRFDPRAIAGKKVIVGASAVDLGDNFTVPVYKIMSGVFLQALAYESLVQGRAIYRGPPGWSLLVALLLALALGPRFAGWSWRAGFAIASGAAIMAVLIPLAVQTAVPLSIDAAPIILLVFLCYGVGLWRLIDKQTWAIFRHRLDVMHQRATMKSLVEDSFDGIAIVDQDGRIEVFNGAAEKILGQPAEDAIGAPIQSCLPLPAGDEIAAPHGDDGDIDAPGRLGPACGYSELTLAREDGAELVIELMVSESRLSITKSRQGRRNQSRILHIYTFRDITQRKKTEEAQKQALEEVSSANRAKTEFLANMSHELRTPLNAVIGFSELIKSEPFGPIGAPQYMDYIEDINSSGQHLLAIINDILDMSKIEAGKMTLVESVADFASVTDSCLRLVADRAQNGSVEVSNAVSGKLPFLRADLRMVKQMLLNLMTNAVKFTPEGGRVEVRAEIDVSGCFVVSVSDSGIGIAAEHLEEVMQPFGQADTSLGREYEGTGLGLPLVKAMADLHSATLELESTVGVGTTATIRFPAERVQPRTDTMVA